MHAVVHNRIHRQVFDLDWRGNAGDAALEGRVHRLVKEQLLPALDALFERMDGGDQVLRFDLLRIDLFLESTDFDERLSAQIVSKALESISLQLEHTHAANAVSTGAQPAAQDQSPLRQSPAGRQIEWLIFYLREGYLPWWGPCSNSAEWRLQLDLLFTLPADPTGWEALRVSLAHDRVRQRLIHRFSDADLGLLLEKLWAATGQGGPAGFWRLAVAAGPPALRRQIAGSEIDLNISFFLKHTLAIMNATDGSSYKDALFRALAARDLAGSDQSETTQPSQKPPNGQDDSSSSKQRPDRPRSDTAGPAEGEEIPIPMAGIVLIAPFLPTFFGRLGLWTPGTAHKPAAGDELRAPAKPGLDDLPRCLALLQGMATTNQGREEFELVLLKLLCGIDIATPVPPAYALTAADNAAIEALLQAAIDNWSILKNTSVEGLRVSFIDRGGTLSRTAKGWRLHMQPSSFDMLLQHLPWSIQYIKLPWMDNILQVDWQ
jgi:hypothetical protein